MIHQPCIYPNPKTEKYILDDDYIVRWGLKNIIVPGHFVTDGASIPKFAWGMTYSPFDPVIVGPAIAHDWVYWNHQMSREDADQMLYDLMLENGAGKIKAKAVYQAVRMFGGQYWENDDDDIKNLMLLYVLIKNSPRFDEYHFPVELIKKAA